MDLGVQLIGWFGGVLLATVVGNVVDAIRQRRKPVSEHTDPDSDKGRRTPQVIARPKHHSNPRRPKEIDGFQMLKRLSLEEAARRLGFNEPLEEPRAVDSDSLARWRALRAMHREGDEFWYYTTDERSWKTLAGESGIALVRGDKIVGNIETIVS